MEKKLNPKVEKIGVKKIEKSVWYNINIAIMLV